MAEIKLNPKMIKDICAYIENGNTIERACILCDISKVTFYNWVNRGKEDQGKNKKSIFANFLNAAEKAKQKYIAYHIQLVNQSAKQGNSADSKWILQNIAPNEFTPKQNINMSGNIKHSVSLEDLHKELDEWEADE